MKQSAGILLYRKEKQLWFLLVHPGGPFWKNKDAGAWSIPKGEFTADEDPLKAARREFKEETGFDCDGEFIPLQTVQLASGKKIHAWALEQDLDAGNIKSNEFEMEWPPKSGKKQSFPEIDRAAWFGAAAAKLKLNAAQAVWIDELERLIAAGG
jgi:predicted NUDIX family NTP pyrophosphohydrolase